jgi:cell division protein FtsI/penicillin-binding protein 2
MNLKLFFGIFLLMFFVITSNAQVVTLSGVVYDISGRRPIESVVVNSGNNKAITDSLGRYLITVKQKDSVWFSLFGKNTQKFPVDTVSDPHNFNIMIHVAGYDLPEVRVRNSYYRLDSIQNRNDYAKYFNYQPPGLRLSNNQQLFGPAGLTVGFDLDEIINMFRFHRNKNLQFLQKRLLTQEHDKYIDYRFTKRFVQKLTHLEGESLSKFMSYCRPSYELLGLLNDLELGLYIEKKYQEYKKGR